LKHLRLIKYHKVKKKHDKMNKTSQQYKLLAFETMYKKIVAKILL